MTMPERLQALVWPSTSDGVEIILAFDVENWLADLRREVHELPAFMVDTRFDPDDEPLYRRAVLLDDLLALLDGAPV